MSGPVPPFDPPLVDQEASTSRYAQFLRRLFALHGKRKMAVSPVVQLSLSDEERLEYWALAGIRPFSLTIQLAASAGNKNYWNLWNPVGSGNIVVCEVAQFFAAAADDIFVRIADGDFTGGLNFQESAPIPRDARHYKVVSNLGNISTRFQTLQTNVALPGTKVGTLFRAPNSTAFVQPAGSTPKAVAVLVPGWGVRIEGGTANVVQTGTFWGYERNMELAELNP